MIFATVAVGEQYIDSVCENVVRFEDQGYDIHILTDKPHRFNKYTIYEYPNLIFSYTDKLLFSIMLARKFKMDVFYSDVNKIGEVTPAFYEDFKGSENITVKGTWESFTPEWSEIKYQGEYWAPFIRFLSINNVTPSLCPAFCEQHIYIPKNLNYHSILLHLETVKPVLEYCSIVGENKYPGIGSGEGAGLGYALFKNNLTVDSFNNSYFSKG